MLNPLRLAPLAALTVSAMFTAHCSPAPTPPADAASSDATQPRDTGVPPMDSGARPDAQLDSGTSPSPDAAMDAPDPCSALVGCEACAADPTCGYCQSSGRCLSGSDTASSDGTCRGSEWAWTQDRCAMPDASASDAAQDASMLTDTGVSVDSGVLADTGVDSGACAAGQTSCAVMGAARCVNTQSDRAHCGACNNACVGTHNCSAGVCRPANDQRTSAANVTMLTLEREFTQSTVGATDDGTGCSFEARATVWYRFSIATRTVFYADTAGSSYDTTMFVTNAAGAAIPETCNDDARCPTGIAGGFTAMNQSRLAVVLSPGDYYLAIGGFGGATGTLVLHMQSIASTVGAYFYDAPMVGSMTTTSTTLPSGSVAVGARCVGPSGEDVRWFMTCGSTSAAGSLFSLCAGDGATFTRAQGATTYDPTLALYSGNTGAVVDCNDDGPAAAMCAGTGGDGAIRGPRLTARVPRGIAAVIVDDLLATSGMRYTMRHNIEP